MEPSDLNAPSNDDARLAALLRSTATPLADDGFTQRVLTALPPSKAAAAPWLRTLLCLAGTVAGCGIVLWRGLSWLELKSGADRLATALGNDATLRLLDPLSVSAITVATVSLLFAFRVELRERFL